jgi:hypothetical protein
MDPDTLKTLKILGLVLLLVAVALISFLMGRGRLRRKKAARQDLEERLSRVGSPFLSGEKAVPRLDDNVQFTVYRPRVIRPEEWYPILAFAHLTERRPEEGPPAPDPVEQVRSEAARILGPQSAIYQDVRQDSSGPVPQEGELVFALVLPGMDVNPPRRSFRWQEQVHREEFRVRAPAELDGRTVRGHLSVFLGGIVLADVPLGLRVAVSAPGEPREAPADADSARPYRRIFASYSHKDWPVVEQHRRFAQALGDQYLIDCSHLRSGEVWSAALGQLIRDADVFQLFWSSNSMTSPFVRQEWEYALELNRPHFIRPTYWEEPLPSVPEHDLPPEALRRLHFQHIALPALSCTVLPLPAGRPTEDDLFLGGRPQARRARVGLRPGGAASCRGHRLGTETPVGCEKVEQEVHRASLH